MGDVFLDLFQIFEDSGPETVDGVVVYIRAIGDRRDWLGFPQIHGDCEIFVPLGRLQGVEREVFFVCVCFQPVLVLLVKVEQGLAQLFYMDIILLFE